jgi:hypothetical protein
MWRMFGYQGEPTWNVPGVFDGATRQMNQGWEQHQGYPWPESAPTPTPTPKPKPNPKPKCDRRPKGAAITAPGCSDRLPSYPARYVQPPAQSSGPPREPSKACSNRRAMIQHFYRRTECGIQHIDIEARLDAWQQYQKDKDPAYWQNDKQYVEWWQYAKERDQICGEPTLCMDPKCCKYHIDAEGRDHSEVWQRRLQATAMWTATCDQVDAVSQLLEAIPEDVTENLGMDDDA